ncbi:MAG: cupin domain-containing protein [Niveispirillum sp.]|uniref:cupin domain-containing protein n=1 Tax=Niveispirillum sp. TaxID=1917217 RepID=UPI0040351592
MTASFRRIVTCHDDTGLSVIRSIDTLTPSLIDTGDAAFQLVWATPTVPANLNDGTDGLLGAGKTLHGGSVIRIVDMLPGRASPLHRSWSIDYGIILSGVLELELDDGSVTALAAGDIVVQRATNHLWRNPSPDQACRIAFVLIEAKPVVAGGRVLPEIHP